MELLVVISIIGLLVALLLPAIEGARESARRTACGSKMRDVGVALHGYQARNGSFPPAGRGYSWCDTGVKSKGGRGVGDTVIYNSNGLVELLPFLNQRNLYDSFDHGSGFTTGTTSWKNTAVPASTSSYAGSASGRNQNAEIAKTYVDVFRCPSDRQDPNLHMDPAEATNYDFIGVNSIDSTFGDSFTLLDEFGLEHSHPNEGGMCNTWRVAGPHARMFGQNSTTTPAHVRDGLSNTFAVGETTVFWSPHGAARWAARVPIYGQGIDPNVINNWTVQNGSSDETLGAFYPRRGVLANNNTNAGSLHPGGCQIVMGDGAVRFLSEQTASSILVQLKRMRDGHAPQDW